MSKTINKTFIVTLKFNPHSEGVHNAVQTALDDINKQLGIFRQKNPKLVELSISDSVSTFSFKEDTGIGVHMEHSVTYVTTVLFSI